MFFENLNINTGFKTQKEKQNFIQQSYNMNVYVQDIKKMLRRNKKHQINFLYYTYIYGLPSKCGLYSYS